MPGRTCLSLRTAFACLSVLAFALGLGPASARAQVTFEARVSASTDDGREDFSSGNMKLDEPKNELGKKKWIGLRFQNVNIPQGATITAAYVQFRATDNDSVATQFTIFGQAHDSAPAFTTTNSDFTNRTKTTASVTWANVASWTGNLDYQTPSITSIVQELVNRAGWTTTSEMAILIRSDDANGHRRAESYDGTATLAPLLHVEYTTPYATSESYRLYVQRFAAWNPTAASTWHTINLSGAPYYVPAGKVVEIIIKNSDPNNEQSGGVRAAGSSLERRVLLHEAEAGGIDAVTMHVQTNASSQIQCYGSSTSLVSFRLVGYWSRGSYQERMDTFTASSASSWHDRNLGTYGVGANQVAEVVMTNSDPDTEYETGVRAKGSSLQRTALLHEAQDGGVDAATLFVQASKSSDAVIQVYTANTTFVGFYLVGYWTRPPGKFTEKFSDVGVPASDNTWLDKSLSSSSVPAEAVASMALVNREAGSENTLGVRENDSYDSRLFTPHQAKDGGGDYVRAHVTTDASSTIEWYASTHDVNKADFVLTGYWEPATGSLLMVVADAQTPSTQELARLTLLEGWGYLPNLIDDGASQATYDTAIQYNDLVYVPQEASAAAIGTKLNSASLGIVSEVAGLIDDFGFAASSGSTTSTSLVVADNTHYITSPFSAGALTVFTASQAVTTISGVESAHLQAPGLWGAAKGLVALEAGARTYVTNGKTAGRRVQLPWGGAGFDINVLNSNGQTILRRSLEWASALIGYWKFNETTGTNADDASGYQNDGTLAGGLTFDANAVPAARINGGLDFDGTSDYVAANSSVSLEIETAITLSAWVKPDALSTAYLFDKDSDASYYLKLNVNGSISVGNAGVWSATSAGSLITAGQWQHVVATYNSATGTAVVYLNGVAVKTQTGLSGALGISGSDLIIGANDTVNGSYFGGLLDDLRVYNYALGAAEVTALRKTGISGVRILKWVEIQ